MTGIKIFNKLTMFRYNFSSISENYARLRVNVFVVYCYLIRKYIYIYIYIYKHIYIYTYIYFCFSIHYICSLNRFGYHFIISLVTAKNKYNINALMKKVSYDNTLYLKYKTATKCNLLSFFNTQLESGTGRSFTCVTFGKCLYYNEHVSE